MEHARAEFEKHFPQVNWPKVAAARIEAITIRNLFPNIGPSLVNDLRKAAPSTGAHEVERFFQHLTKNEAALLECYEFGVPLLHQGEMTPEELRGYKPFPEPQEYLDPRSLRQCSRTTPNSSMSLPLSSGP